MKHGSLFSGIGGFDLAAQWMEWENLFQCEKDEWCRKVLTKNFKNTKRYEDIKDFDGTEYRGRVDIISGGFPCQPFSTAGSRKGTDDERYLWPEMLRVIQEAKPKFFVGENVGGLVNWNEGLVLETVCAEVEAIGYQIAPFIIPACAIGSQHRRERIWFIGCLSDTSGLRCGELDQITERYKCDGGGKAQRFIEPLYRRGDKFYRHDGTEIVRDTDGIPGELDKNRIKGLGNAIVPQVAYEIFKAIQAVAVAPFNTK